MPQQSDTQIIQLVSSAWRRRRVLVYPIIIVPILGLLTIFLMPKQYMMPINVTVFRSYAYNPFYTTAGQERALSSSIRTYLRGHDFINDAARIAGLITPEMSTREKTKMVNEISAKLTPSRLTGSQVRMWYKDTTTDHMALLGRALMVLGTEHIRNALAKQNIVALRQGIKMINKDVGVSTARLAALRSRYKENHSEVRVILSQLIGLRERRGELIRELQKQQNPAWSKNVHAGAAAALNQKKDVEEYEKLINLKFFILPKFPNTVPNLILSFIVITIVLVLLGIGSGIGLAAILESLDSNIRHRETLEALTEQMVLGRIPLLADKS